MSSKLEFFRILGNKTRYKILQSLAEGEKCACSFVPLVKKSQPNVSLHLKKMEDFGIIKSRKEGTKVIYSLKDKKTKRILEIFNND